MVYPGLEHGVVRRRRVLAIAWVTVVLWSAPSFAQIYSWRDANGRLVLSDRKLDPSAATFAVPDAPDIEVTRPAAATGRARFEPLVQEHAARHALRPELVRAVIQVESGYNPRARSPKGAMGLMQLMPATAKQFGVIDPFNPAENIRAGVSYLRQLLDRYDHDEQLALAAYNAGPAAVDKYGSQIPPYKETQNYVLKITGINGNVRGAPGLRIYRVTEIVDGRPVVKYTNTRPASGDFVEVRR